eukprot:12936910-Prorocentrum_lima.AAC.1
MGGRVYRSKLEMVVKLGCALEPRAIMMVLTGAADKVIHEDAMFRRAWYDKTTQHSSRNLHSVWEVWPFVKS